MAFRALYEEMSPKLLGVILRIVRSRAEAEEVLQDVFVRVWKNAASYAPESGSPGAWITSIARHRAIDVVRKKAPMTLAPAEDGADWTERIADPLDSEAQMAHRNALIHCLDTLEQPVRDLVVLAYCEGYSREELASRYDRPVNTVKTWLHRGLGVLKTCLEARA